jgi:hypothetical protein
MPQGLPVGNSNLIIRLRRARNPHRIPTIQRACLVSSGEIRFGCLVGFCHSRQMATAPALVFSGSLCLTPQTPIMPSFVACFERMMPRMFLREHCGTAKTRVTVRTDWGNSLSSARPPLPTAKCMLERSSKRRSGLMAYTARFREEISRHWLFTDFDEVRTLNASSRVLRQSKGIC